MRQRKRSVGFVPRGRSCASVPPSPSLPERGLPTRSCSSDETVLSTRQVRVFAGRSDRFAASRLRAPTD